MCAPIRICLCVAGHVDECQHVEGHTDAGNFVCGKRPGHTAEVTPAVAKPRLAPAQLSPASALGASPVVEQRAPEEPIGTVASLNKDILMEEI